MAVFEELIPVEDDLLFCLSAAAVAVDVVVDVVADADAVADSEDDDCTMLNFVLIIEPDIDSEMTS